MPAYLAGTGFAIYPGDIQTVWNAETITTGSKSQAVALAQCADGAVFNISFDIRFSGAPGAFTINCQTADKDTDGDYVSITGGSLTTVNAGQTVNYQAQVKALFARLLMTTQPGNSVTVTATIAR